MLELYESRTSVCVQKVRLVCCEKGLEWASHFLREGGQFDPEYLKLNPNAVVPTLIHDGHVIIESTVIINYLDEVFPNPPLMPADPLLRARVRMFTKLIDEYVHNSATIMSFATAYRYRMARLSPEQREEMLTKAPDQKRSAFKRDLIENGLESPYVVEATRNFTKMLNWIETAVEHGPYLAGNTYSLADVAVTPYVSRLDLLRLSRMWENRPGVKAWYARIRERPSFDRSVTQFMNQTDRDDYGKYEPDAWPKISSIMSAL